MAMIFHVLASSSAGNASLLESDGFCVLLDFGLGPRQLADRLHACGRSWNQVRAAVLTHTHGDHWSAPTLAELLERRIPLYCHAAHVAELDRAQQVVSDMSQAGLVHCFEAGRPWELPNGCRCLPLELSHDSDMTCGFRFDGPADIFGPSWSLGYAADLGSWDESLAEQLCDVDVLAVEFNHDVDLQRRSGRPYFLIRRVLGDHGHLSNAQAAALVQAVVARSEPGRLRHVVQLHLSAECNRPSLARAAVEGATFRVHTAQEQAGLSVRLQTQAPRRRTARARGRAEGFVQPVLPGWD